ncbi:MAG: hypothetical protein GY801_35255 [bacterium]|nr:hypothetical protein [bacterium]
MRADIGYISDAVLKIQQLLDGLRTYLVELGGDGKGTIFCFTLPVKSRDDEN